MKHTFERGHRHHLWPQDYQKIGTYLTKEYFLIKRNGQIQFHKIYLIKITTKEKIRYNNCSLIIFEEEVSENNTSLLSSKLETGRLAQIHISLAQMWLVTHYSPLCWNILPMTLLCLHPLFGLHKQELNVYIFSI